MRQPKPSVPIVRVIADPRDASKDYYLSAPIAEASFKVGLLAWDETNRAYCDRR
jgi:hypothetical protein